ncbi:MAG: sensor histidine kinase [Pseudomonadota bacterium]
MLDRSTLLLICLGYAGLLFLVAAWAERRAAEGRLGWIRSPLVYTLSLSVYCTAWTFYGAVGSAARSGLEFATIYLGPSLVFFGWWFLLRKLVRIGQAQRITSIADLLSSRYGKSATLGVVVTLLALIATTPYIALQLQSMTLSLTALTAADPAAPRHVTAFWLALGLALFAILFGTRRVDANERHHGVVAAVALEAVVKLLAVVAVGLFVVFGLPGLDLDALPSPTEAEAIFTPRWITLTFLSATAIICLPRMFQVLVVENADERHLATAAWAFPTYLFLISLFVLPIALAGQAVLPEGANPDLYVLTVPLAEGQTTLALVAFLGGFSAATSMVIVSTIALSTMISNHIAVPIWLRLNRRKTQTSGDVRAVVLSSRRGAMALILTMGYFYFLVSGGGSALASIGLRSFAGIAQVLPALLGGLFWHGATRPGAIAGIVTGFLIWCYTLFLPSFGGGVFMSEAVLQDGLFGLAVLRPTSLFGVAFDDPLVHTVYWSLSLNAAVFVGVSLLLRPSPMEQVQGAAFVDAFAVTPGHLVQGRVATAEDLFALAQRILGVEPAHKLFAAVSRTQGKAGGLPDADEDLIARVERELAGSVGSASAHAMVSQIAQGGQIPVDQLIRMADETAQIVEYSHRLERQSEELERTAAQLRAANTRLRELGAQKDAFLSQVSHELRTPMTSIRSFAEILRDHGDVSSDEAKRFLAIIHGESQRLTRLLDEILDLSVLESGRARLEIRPVRLGDAIASAAGSTEGLRHPEGVRLEIAEPHLDALVMADFDRLAQVIINLISNAVKYGTTEVPVITIRATPLGAGIAVDVIDHGPGILSADRERAFEKFARLDEMTLAGSAGLGLPISREIMRNLGGDLVLMDSGQGAHFRLTLPQAQPVPAVAAS